MTKKFAYILLFTLFGCSLTPLHKFNNEHDSILTKVELGKINGEKEYILRHYLETELNPNNVQSEKDFVLDLHLAYFSEPTLVQKDSTIANSEMIVNASFALHNIKNNKKIKEGNIKVVTNYEENLSSFSSFSQKNKAYDNALKEIARSVKSYIIIALLNNDYITNESTS
ncbi:MAG: hypothetical protein K0T99_01795 [Alphaproteobacteria bacterium]|nr:hypothetical protein [Alphaproteobacteria bacterium]